MAGMKSSRSEIGGNVFILLIGLIVVIGFVAGAGLIMAVINYSSNLKSAAALSNLGSLGGGQELPGGAVPGGVVPGGDVPGGALPGGDVPGGAVPGDDRGLVGSEVHYDSKTWTIQISGANNRVSYIDRKSRRFEGYLFDVIHAVCLIAGKNCALVHSDFNNCWKDGFPQEGLLGGWYDACSLWSVTLDRLRSVKFSAPFTQIESPVFVTLPGNPLNFNPNNLDRAAIGFLNGWWSDRFCLFFSKGVDLLDSQVFIYSDPTSALNALQQREVDALFVSESVLFPSGLTQVVEFATPCLQGGNAMMMRHDSLFRDWWDPAFQTLIHSREYREICTDIEDPNVHGDKPGGNADQICV